MNSGTLVLGLVNGLTISFLAVGLVLVYRANRFLNLAHAQFGVISSLLVAKLVVDEHWNWWLAFLVCVPVGGGLAVAAYRILIERLQRRTRSTIVLLLASIGVTELLLMFGYIPALSPSPGALAQAGGYPLPFSSHVRVGGINLYGDSILICILVPVIVVALVLALRYTTFGRLVRASAANAGEARLCGIPVQRVSTWVWSIAGAMSAITAILAARSEGAGGGAVTGVAQGFGPDLLLVALGAAALGGFRSISLAVVGGIGLGLAKQFTLGVSGDAGEASLVVFVLILLVVLLRGRAIAAAFGGSTVDFEDQGKLVVPDLLRDHTLVRHRLAAMSCAAGALALIAPVAPYFRTDAHRFLLILIVVFAIVSVSLTVLMGWGGQVSLGHFAVLGAGAFVTVRLVPHAWSLPAIMVVAGLVGSLLMVIVGIPALRIKGLSLAVTTLGLAVVAPQWLYSRSFFGGSQASGAFLEESPALGRGLAHVGTMQSLYYVALAALVVVLITAYGLRRSRAGRLLVAVRDNERAAEVFGVSPTTVKLSVLAVSGFIVGAAGTIFALAYQQAAANQFTPDLSLSILAVPVIGGVGSLSGAVLGALAVYVPTYFASPLLTPVFGKEGAQTGVLLFMTGIFLPLMLLRYPKGLAGAGKRLVEKMLESAAEQRSEAVVDDPRPVVVEDVTLSFGGVHALNGTSIELRSGEILGLIGPNGAGKSTLLNVIAGVSGADRGSVRISGREVSSFPASYRAAFGLTRTFQDARLFPGLTVTEAVQVAASRRYRTGLLAAMAWAPWARRTERRSHDNAFDIVDRFGLTRWGESLITDLSTGTRRICDLALQVAAGARVLLLDEPTAGVAQREAEAFVPLLRALRDELDCSIIIVEHDMPLLMALCDRIYAMELGRVIAEGTPADIRSDPAVIASYLGTDDVAITRSGAGKTRVGARPRGRSASRTPEAATAERKSRTRRADAAPSVTTEPAAPRAPRAAASGRQSSAKKGVAFQ